MVAIDGEHLGVTFDAACDALSRLQRLHLELDGSFVWRGGDWQLDGMMYDRDEWLRYVDLKGDCPGAELRAIFDAVTNRADAVRIVRIPGGELYDLQSFEMFFG